jgi:hypothetical protein
MCYNHPNGKSSMRAASNVLCGSVSQEWTALAVLSLIMELWFAWYTGKIWRETIATYEQRRGELAETPVRNDNTTAIKFRTRSILGMINNSTWFSLMTMTTIMLNVAWAAYDLDVHESVTWTTAPLEVQIMENYFCTYFLLELIVRVGALKRRRECIYDAWLCFDSLLVVLSISDTWVLPLYIWILDGASGPSASEWLAVIRLSSSAFAITAGSRLGVLTSKFGISLKNVDKKVAYTMTVKLCTHNLCRHSQRVKVRCGDPEVGGFSYRQPCAVLHGDVITNLIYLHVSRLLYMSTIAPSGLGREKLLSPQGGCLLRLCIRCKRSRPFRGRPKEHTCFVCMFL